MKRTLALISAVILFMLGAAPAYADEAPPAEYTIWDRMPGEDRVQSIAMALKEVPMYSAPREHDSGLHQAPRKAIPCLMRSLQQTRGSRAARIKTATDLHLPLKDTYRAHTATQHNDLSRPIHRRGNLHRVVQWATLALSDQHQPHWTSIWSGLGAVYRHSNRSRPWNRCLVLYAESGWYGRMGAGIQKRRVRQAVSIRILKSY